MAEALPGPGLRASFAISCAAVKEREFANGKLLRNIARPYCCCDLQQLQLQKYANRPSSQLNADARNKGCPAHRQA